ncbi:MAG: hypothetical protein ACI9Y1_001476 [Lentisphaeria bacterium]|jgi:hypothetical protein
MIHPLRVTRKILAFWHIPVREKLWFFILYPYSGLVRAAILFIPFHLLSKHLGTHHKNTQLSPLVDEQQLVVARQIGRICEITARYTPWQSKCFVQAAMARTVLAFYSIPYVIHLGATTSENPEKPIEAHAWVKVGPAVITGRPGHKAYSILSSFVAPQILDNQGHDE